MSLFRIRITVAFSLLAILPLSAAGDQEVEERLAKCTMVLGEILNIPDGIPRELLD